MPFATLFHNPGAGKENHSRTRLISMLRSNDIDCRYSSTKKKGWEKDLVDPKSDFVIIAGGDGTVKKVIRALMDEPVLDAILPLGLITLGTANNISKTLNLNTNLEQLIASWKNGNICNFDVGRLFNVPGEKFFLESFGFGIFPYLMMTMKKNKDESLEADPEKKLRQSLQFLKEIVREYEPRQCELKIDGKDFSGEYILAEVMNTNSIGPKLKLAPDGDSSDGFFDVVLVKAEEKENFLKYVSSLAEGEELSFNYQTIKGKNIAINWDGTHMHVDDTITKIKKQQVVEIKIRHGLLNFMTG